MDPNANLREQRQLQEVLQTTESSEERLDALERIAELAEALDGWLNRRGFLPRAWERCRVALADYYGADEVIIDD
jgi:hypothetical protein